MIVNKNQLGRHLLERLVDEKNVDMLIAMRFFIIHASMHQFQTDLLRETLTPYILVLSTSLNVQNRKDRKFSFAFCSCRGQNAHAPSVIRIHQSAWAPSAHR